MYQKVHTTMEENNIIRLPLKNKHGDVVDYTIIDSIDFDKIKDYTINRCGKTKFYAVAMRKNTKIRLHHLILNKPDPTLVVDHINGNSLDNRKNNLQIVTVSQNNQNRSKKEGSSSQYIGVWKTKTNKWVAECCNVKTILFQNEVEAAEAYDTFAFVRFGKNARTNNLIEYTQCANMTLQECIDKFCKTVRELPKGISMEQGKYSVAVKYNGQAYRARLLNTIEEAQQQLDVFHMKVQEQRAKEQQDLQAQPILRNSDNIAVIPIRNIKRDVVAYALVSDEDYYHLVQNSWSSANGYAVGRPQGKKVFMHVYIFALYNTSLHDVVDHINCNKLDNRRDNLRGNTYSGNSHNCKKSKLSELPKGVQAGKGKWTSEITKDHKYYHIGTFDTVTEATLAYNEKAKELYGEFASLNVIS